MSLLIKIIILFAGFQTSLALHETNSVEEDSSNNWTLELVAVAHRHGFRAPESTWPNDPYRDGKKYWPAGWGQLLLKGKQQLYQLGKTLRSRYKHLVTKYSPNTVRINSSDYDRCHMSVAALAAGWFPPQTGQKWSRKLPWQPVPIHSVPANQDRIFSLRAPCPRFYYEKAKIEAQVVANETAEDKQLYKYLTEYMGEPVTTLKQIEISYSTLLIEERNGLQLPAWTKSVFPGKLKEKGMLNIQLYTWTDYLQRVFGGPMLKEILNQFTMKSKGQNKDKKAFIYSVHDVTMIHILRTLKFQDIPWPEFGAALLFELHKSVDKHYFVKLLFMQDTMTKHPYELNIPGCSKPCSLEKLLALTEYVRAVNWDVDCKL